MTAPHLGPGHAVAGRYTIRALLGFTGEAATYHAASSQGQEVVLKLFDPAIGQRADVMSQLERTQAQVAAMPPDRNAAPANAATTARYASRRRKESCMQCLPCRKRLKRLCQVKALAPNPAHFLLTG